MLREELEAKFTRLKEGAVSIGTGPLLFELLLLAPAPPLVEGPSLVEGHTSMVSGRAACLWYSCANRKRPTAYASTESGYWLSQLPSTWFAGVPASRLTGYHGCVIGFVPAAQPGRMVAARNRKNACCAHG